MYRKAEGNSEWQWIQSSGCKILC